MSKFTISPELQQILDVLQNEPDGVKISGIEEALPTPTPRRTLLRRLSELTEHGLITIRGEKSARKYYLSKVESVLPLSAEAQALKAQINRPLQQRIPVAYNTEFLYSYRPNDTYYLPEKTRKHLQKVGQQFNHQLEPGTYAKRILHRLLIDLSWNSSRLEGNTYSLLETERLLEFGSEAEGKSALEVQMILNHKDTIEFMIKYIDQLDFNSYTVLNIHAFLSRNLLANPKARGQLRQIPVGIGKTVYHPAEIPQIIAECFQQILDLAKAINDPFEQAFFVMVQLPYLQPFEDVNKRVSRLVSNIPLIKHNLSPLSFTDVPKSDYISGLLAIYELNKIELMRDVFVWAYERSAQQYQLIRDTLGEPNLVQLKFNKELFELIHLIVANNIRGNDIIETTEKWSQQHIPKKSQAEFIRIVEKELASLHFGNIATYDIHPDVFEKWQIK